MFWERMFWETDYLGNCSKGNGHFGNRCFWETDIKLNLIFWEKHILGSTYIAKRIIWEKVVMGTGVLGTDVLGNG